MKSDKKGSLLWENQRPSIVGKSFHRIPTCSQKLLILSQRHKRQINPAKEAATGWFRKDHIDNLTWVVVYYWVMLMSTHRLVAVFPNLTAKSRHSFVSCTQEIGDIAAQSIYQCQEHFLVRKQPSFVILELILKWYKLPLKIYCLKFDNSFSIFMWEVAK